MESDKGFVFGAFGEGI
jgi:hypothetical protein